MHDRVGPFKNHLVPIGFAHSTCILSPSDFVHIQIGPLYLHHVSYRKLRLKIINFDNFLRYGFFNLELYPFQKNHYIVFPYIDILYI